MAVSDAPRYTIPVVSDGAQTQYPYTFRILAPQYLLVYAAGSLLPSTAYSVLGVGDENGGSIQLVTPVPSGQSVQMFGLTPRSQQITYEEGDTFPAASHENGHDRRAMVDLEIEQRGELSPRFPETIPLAQRNIELPSFAGNALKLWQINATENGITYADSTLLTVTVDPVSGEVHGKSEVLLGPTDFVAGKYVATAVGLIPAGVAVKMVTSEVRTTIGGATKLQVGGMGLQDGWGGNIAPTIGTIHRTPRRTDMPFTINAENVNVVVEDGAAFNGTGEMFLRAHWVSYSPQ